MDFKEKMAALKAAAEAKAAQLKAEAIQQAIKDSPIELDDSEEKVEYSDRTILPNGNILEQLNNGEYQRIIPIGADGFEDTMKAIKAELDSFLPAPAATPFAKEARSIIKTEQLRPIQDYVLSKEADKKPPIEAKEHYSQHTEFQAYPAPASRLEELRLKKERKEISLKERIELTKLEKEEQGHAKHEESRQEPSTQVQEVQPEADSNAQGTLHSTAPAVQSDSPVPTGTESKTTDSSNESSVPVSGNSVDAKEVLGQYVAEEKKKLSLKEILEMRKKAQEEAALAMEPDEEVTSSLAQIPDTAASVAYEPTVPQEQELKKEPEPQQKLETFALNITLNKEQLAAKELAFAGKSFCLIGAAGTGKTSTQRDVAKTLVKEGGLRTVDYKIAGGGGNRVVAPSIAFCAYTRRASANLARAIHKDPELAGILGHNIMTIHHLLEYEPVIINILDEATGEYKQSMRFEPQRHAGNPLQITHLVIEEASMVGLDLWEKLYDALPCGVQIIFIGDINQLPPVFGASILNYALVQLPVVELKQVYRQQGDSLVLANAHNILKGKSLEEGKGFTIMRGKSPVQVGQGKMSQALALAFQQMFERGDYDPEDCIILSPFNKQDLGTDMMNKHIAQFLGKARGAVVHEVLAGMNKHYLAVGDKVMYNKQDGVITEINRNGLYHGKEPQLPGTDLSRFGVRILGESSSLDIDDFELGYENFSIEDLEEQQAERKQQASHSVHVMMETGQELILENAGDFSQQIFTLGYVLTVHKAQGCEWRKVFGILHKDHSVMLFRELLYTLVTRAREEVVLIAKDAMVDKAIRNPRIKGDSLQDKLEFFNSGAVDSGVVSCTK